MPSSEVFRLYQHTHCATSVNLMKDVKADLRIIHGVFSRKIEASRECFVSSGSTTGAAASIDYTQSGTLVGLIF